VACRITQQVHNRKRIEESENSLKTMVMSSLMPNDPERKTRMKFANKQIAGLWNREPGIWQADFTADSNQPFPALLKKLNWPLYPRGRTIALSGPKKWEGNS